MSEETKNIGDPDVVTKYMTAAGVANKAMRRVLDNLVGGTRIESLCAMGDQTIEDLTARVYKHGGIRKGIAFPTCISVNNCLGHYSPLSDDTTVLPDQGTAKIDLAVHVDGFIASVAQTALIKSAAAEGQPTVSGRAADVMCATHFAAEAALRLLKPGRKNMEVTDAIEKIASEFHVTPIEGVVSREVTQYVMDGGERIILNVNKPEHRVEPFEFEQNQVYTIDIMMSTGEGRGRELNSKTTVYKRIVDNNYLLKLKASREVFNEINKKYPVLPFTMRAIDNRKSWLGIVECVKHDLLEPFPVLYEREEEFVAQVKFTALITGSNTLRVTETIPPHGATSEYSITDPAINALLATSTKRKKKKAKKVAPAKPTPMEEA